MPVYYLVYYNIFIIPNVSVCQKIWACKLVEGLLDHVSFNIKISKFCIEPQSNADHNLINRCTLHPNHNQVKAYNQN